MGFIADNYGVAQTSPLMTDKYHFTTAYAYWREGRADNPAIFYMFGRKEAQHSGYSVAAGLEGVIDIVRRWQEFGVTDDDIAYLRTQKSPAGDALFAEEFLTYLRNMEFKLKIDAAPEGSVFFPQEPVLRVEGPLAQAKMLESVALGLINGHSAYITHAARQTDVLTEELPNGSPTGSASVQGLRRGPSLGAALEASRSLGAGGYTTTSTGTAAKQFGQAFAGTMDHAWIMTHENELGTVPLAGLYQLQEHGDDEKLREALVKDAFRSYAMSFPKGGIFLVDTYDPLQGLENAITVMKEMRALGHGANYGVRFDSGDIAKYSKIALRRYAEEGFVTGLDPQKVKDMPDAELLKQSKNCTAFCAAADGIDEYSAQDIRAGGGFFSSWGIGTAGSHVPPLGLVYKASAVFMDVLQQDAKAGRKTPVMKVASNAPFKSSNPGKINSRRHYDAQGKLSHVVLFDEDLGLDPAGRQVNLRNFNETRVRKSGGATADLLVPVFDASGNYVYREPPQKESFPGSGHRVTDLGVIAAKVRAELDTFPESVRQVARPRDEILKGALLQAFTEAQRSGRGKLTLDIAAIEAALPPEVAHIPVFLDQRLFEQRRACEVRHLGHTSGAGVAAYKERFEGGEEPRKKSQNGKGDPAP
jgi:nicotinate phosphoribosyltransferase